MSDNVLRARGLSRSFGATEALRAIDLEIQRGEFVAIVGPSGCGKTTLLHLLCGHDEPSAGTVERRGAVRMVYQKDGLFPWLTVAENVGLGIPSSNGSAARRHQIDELLAFIRLGSFADHYPHQLSGGMRQLVEVARAIAGDTQVLLLDEPFSALDYLARLRMREELARMLSERPRTVVLVTHDIEEAAQLADRIVILTGRPGRVLRELRIESSRPRDPTDPAVIGAMHSALSAMGLERASRSWPQEGGGAFRLSEPRP